MPEQSRPPIGLRPAGIDDIDAIVELLAGPASEGQVLPRSRLEVEERIRNFQVAEAFDAGGRIVGCVALRDFGAGLYEVRSLVVQPEYMNQRIGSQLIAAAVQCVRKAAGNSVFALTYHPRLFEHQGFERVDKRMFPLKVWHDCRKCRKRHACDEIALLLRLA